MDGGLIVGLAQDAADGLAELELGELGTITLSGLGFVEDASGAAVLLSGTLQLSVLSPALQWPTVELQGLRISAAGEVELPDGWRAVRGRAATPDERPRLWARWAEYDGEEALASWAARRSRETAVVIFEPRPSA